MPPHRRRSSHANGYRRNPSDKKRGTAISSAPSSDRLRDDQPLDSSGSEIPRPSNTFFLFRSNKEFGVQPRGNHTNSPSSSSRSPVRQDDSLEALLPPTAFPSFPGDILGSLNFPWDDACFLYDPRFLPPFLLNTPGRHPAAEANRFTHAFDDRIEVLRPLGSAHGIDCDQQQFGLKPQIYPLNAQLTSPMADSEQPESALGDPTLGDPTDGLGNDLALSISREDEFLYGFHSDEDNQSGLKRGDRTHANLDSLTTGDWIPLAQGACQLRNSMLHC
ncbi:hypothetical protein V5O48_012381 [Marasmius crinis-equi]|uniref:Uncharacterized protein n=1 Tax=Marasmius crinis-equi TaxID=585013 RepID=A0ABR3F396_9AGAR